MNPENDGRRRITFKRKIESLEEDRDLLLRLVDTIRNDDSQTTPGIMNLIRSSASLEEIRLSLDRGPDSSSSNDVQTKIRRPAVQRFMDVKRLSDVPLYEVPAQPWTSVTDDDALVSHLISLYFTWQHPILNWIDRDLFLRDMRSKNLNSRFCSPLLVNIPQFYSGYPEAFARADDPGSRGRHFYEEAIRLLNKEEGRLPLTTLQARGDIYTRTATLSLQKPSIVKIPKFEPLPQTHGAEDTWIPYPRQAKSQQAHTNCVITGVFNLAVILWDISNYLFGDEKPLSLDPIEADAFYYRLTKWAEDLPECISLKNTPTPGVMDMHMRYHNAILVMYGFIQPSLKQSESAAKDRIKILRLATARAISAILNQFRSLWPLEYVPMNSMQYATVALFTLLEDLEDQQNKKVFGDILTALRALSRRWQLAKGMLRLVQLTAIKEEVNLPNEAQILFTDFEAELWKADDREQFSSLYPNFAVSINQGKSDQSVDGAELDRFLDEWDKLALSEREGESDNKN
ncbi:hypothetical protein N7448_009365 [Penicillium atrosanguineum]|uniref:Transcription factor domain-containing protein n=1 Tax=Penicillium atrosanguineum TaxID=1132637 RepID=A0A9W9Q1V8_9EURO|nr:hypothetical protein N7448_009365 [Penicillium atrosanguineum]KAJ5141898.1 hypothetical protein N7526_002893 [Penicillium atrosanguineum]KAJ5321239.1 hypothetical protein N7476_004241 [Penicillium atrosanguineum]